MNSEKQYGLELGCSFLHYKPYGPTVSFHTALFTSRNYGHYVRRDFYTARGLLL